MSEIALYGGSFDPITNGHYDIIKRGAKLYKKLMIGVGRNPNKRYLFDIETRIRLIQETVKDLAQVSVTSFEGLLIDFARDIGAEVIIRGLRMVTDFDYEFQMGLTNMNINNQIETIFLLTDPNNIFVSSSMVKEIANCGGDISKYVPAPVQKQLIQEFQNKLNPG